MDYLDQKYLFHKIRIDLKDNGILYTYGNILNTKQLFIAYEEISFWNITRQVKTDNFNLFVCIASALVMLKSMMGVYDNPNGIYKGLLPVSAIFFIVFLIVTLLGRIKYVFIDTANGGAIKLLNRNKQTVNVFLEELTSRTKNYLREKYTDIDRDLSKEAQLENLFWLKKIKIISRQEYDKFKSLLMDN